MWNTELTAADFCATELPWHKSRLITLWDMKDFQASTFFYVTRSWVEMARGLRDTANEASPGAPFVRPEKLSETLTVFADRLISVGLTATADGYRRIAAQCAKMPMTEIASRLEILQETAEDEMKRHLFLWIPPHQADAYRQKKPFFGDSVLTRFPSASYDIEETGKCFACGRYTAAVMHAMRSLEHGLRALCSTLGVPFNEGTWSRALERIEKRISVLDSQVKQKGAWKRKRQFYSEAVAEFRHFKDAWRNYACHGHDSYGEERAEIIIAHTGSFMSSLSTRLSEKRIKQP